MLNCVRPGSCRRIRDARVTGCLKAMSLKNSPMEFDCGNTDAAWERGWNSMLAKLSLGRR